MFFSAFFIATITTKDHQQSNTQHHYDHYDHQHQQPLVHHHHCDHHNHQHPLVHHDHPHSQDIRSYCSGLAGWHLMRWAIGYLQSTRFNYDNDDDYANNDNDDDSNGYK